MNAKLLFSAVAAAAAFSINVHAANVVTSGDIDAMSHWYGQGGGLVGSDRVSGLHTGTTKVGVAYDADVAARTNLPRGQATNSDVGVSYDADVAARTNMPRGESAAPSKAAGVAGPKSN